jgi:hypothetical protein
MCFVCLFSSTTACFRISASLLYAYEDEEEVEIRDISSCVINRPRQGTKTSNVPIKPGSTVTQIIHKHICIHYTVTEQRTFSASPHFLTPFFL